MLLACLNAPLFSTEPAPVQHPHPLPQNASKETLRKSNKDRVLKVFKLQTQQKNAFIDGFPPIAAACSAEAVTVDETTLRSIVYGFVQEIQNRAMRIVRNI